MQDSVREFFDLPKTTGDIGIEIEMEGSRIPVENYNLGKAASHWHVTFDGSLRGNSAEYVLIRPVNVKDVDDVINLLLSQFKQLKSNLKPSVRCGVHVHLNVQDLTMKQMATFLTCYLSLEEYLTNFCEVSRRGNHFCLRVKDAEYLTYIINQAFKTGYFNFNDDIRYASVNVAALRRYGSLEFRALETPTDLSKVATWAKMLYYLKEQSKKFESPIEVINSMSEDGAKNFVDHLLGDYNKFFDFEERVVISGIRHAQQIAFGIDWDKDSLKKEKPQAPLRPRRTRRN